MSEETEKLLKESGFKMIFVHESGAVIIEKEVEMQTTQEAMSDLIRVRIEQASKRKSA